MSYIPIEIPTKKYIKAYLIGLFGNKPVMTSRNNIGSKFIDLLQHVDDTNYMEVLNARLDTKIKLYISQHTFRQRGAFLNQINLKQFNAFCQKEIKQRSHEHMDFYLEIHPNVTANLQAVRRKLCIDIESWDEDSMKKDYYRYRKGNNQPLLYHKD